LTWDKGTIREWLAKIVESEALQCDAKIQAALGRALVLIFNRQTSTEQASNTTSQNNGRGFNGMDADFGSSVAKKFMHYGRMTPRQTRAVAKMLLKYAGQLAEEKNQQGSTLPLEQAQAAKAGV
jgi:hypothetical protein